MNINAGNMNINVGKYFNRATVLAVWDSITGRTLALWLTLARYKAATPLRKWRSATDWRADRSRWWGSKRVLADQGRGIVAGPGGTLDGGEGVKSL